MIVGKRREKHYEEKNLFLLKVFVHAAFVRKSK